MWASKWRTIWAKTKQKQKPSTNTRIHNETKRNIRTQLEKKKQNFLTKNKKLSNSTQNANKLYKTMPKAAAATPPPARRRRDKSAELPKQESKQKKGAGRGRGRGREA